MPGPAPLFREIHRLRSLIHEMDEQLARLPRAYRARQEALAKAEASLQAAHDGVKACKVAAAAREKSLREQHALIARHEEQLGTMASKKEYDAKQMEIAFARAECSRLEEEALTAIEEGETIAARIPELEKAVAAAREEVARLDSDMEARVQMWKSERQKAVEKLAEVEPGVPKNLRQTYDKTVESMGHDGFAEVSDRACGCCQCEVTRRDQLSLEAGEFVMCETCGRILYLP